MQRSPIWLIGLIVGLSASCGGTPSAGKRSVASREGARHYKIYCALCHGERAEGYAADNANALANQDFLVSVSDEFLHQAIAWGRPGTPMSAYGRESGGPLDEREIRELVSFIRSHQTQPSVRVHGAVVSGEPKRGRSTYARECASCHGSEGQGKTALSLNNPRYLASASDGQIQYAIAHGRRGTDMPAFRDKIADREIKNVVALIRSWQREVAPTETRAASDRDPRPDTNRDVVINPEGAAAKFKPLREGRYVSAEKVADALSSGARLVILDARPISDWLDFHIPGATPTPFYDMEEIIKRLPRDGTWIVSYCACPHAASGQVMDRLRELGFKNTAVIDEGVLVWKDRGYPISHGREH